MGLDPDTVVMDRTRFEIPLPEADTVFMRSLLLGYEPREDTVAIVPGHDLEVLVPLYPAAFDRCGLPAVERRRWPWREATRPAGSRHGRVVDGR